MMDESMSNVVKEVIESSFKKGKPTDDVTMKAARFIAGELLEEAWKDLERNKNVEEKEKSINKQVGL